MESLIKQTTRKYAIFFFCSVAILLSLGLLCYFSIMPELSLLTDKIGNGVQSIIMMVVLLCIPVTLSIFRRRCLKWQQLDEPADRVKAYGKDIIVRLMIFNIITLLCILMYIFVSRGNAMMLLLMVGIFYLFILPNKFQMCRELNLNPDGSVFVEEIEPEVEKVGDFIVMDEDDDDDFIPKNPKSQAPKKEQDVPMGQEPLKEQAPDDSGDNKSL